MLHAKPGFNGTYVVTDDESMRGWTVSYIGRQAEIVGATRRVVNPDGRLGKEILQAVNRDRCRRGDAHSVVPGCRHYNQAHNRGAR